MDLKQRKYINNNKSFLPQYTYGAIDQLWIDDELNELQLYDGREAPIDINAVHNARNGIRPGDNTSTGSSSKFFSKENMQAAAGVGLDAVDAIDTGDKRGVWDTLDPVYHMAGGKESKVGNAMSDAGVEITKSSLKSGNFYGAIVGAGLKVGGGLVNLIAGTDPEEERQWLLLQEENKRVQKAVLDWNSSFRELKQWAYDKKYGYLKHNTIFGSGAGFKYGKPSGIDPVTGETYRKYKVNTPYGKIDATLNSWVSKGEIIASPDGSMYRVKAGENDTARAHLDRDDIVFSNKIINPSTGNKITKDVPMYAKYGMLDELEYEQERGRNNMKINKNKLLPGFKWGSFLNGNLSSTIASLIAARLQYEEASQPLHRTHVYSPNYQFNPAMSTLDLLSVDYYPIAALNLNTERRSAYNIAKSGGLSAGQKARAYSDLNTNTQRRNQEALYNNMLQNNAYRANAANARIQAGENEAQRRMRANVFNEEMYAKAHNSALQGRLMALFNKINAIQQYYANQFKKDQFDRTLALYLRELDERAKDRLSMYGTNNTNISVPSYFIDTPALYSQQNAFNNYFNSESGKKILFGENPYYENYTGFTPAFMNIPVSAYKKISRRK